jgi:hypothetical protein
MTETEEPTMKLAIDNERLAGAIDRQSEKMVHHADQIRKGSAIRLGNEIERKGELQTQIYEDTAQVVDLISQRNRLDLLIAKGEESLRDAKAELKAVLSSIHDLESEGIVI